MGINDIITEVGRNIFNSADLGSEDVTILDAQVDPFKATVVRKMKDDQQSDRSIKTVERFEVYVSSAVYPNPTQGEKVTLSDGTIGFIDSIQPAQGDGVHILGCGDVEIDRLLVSENRLSNDL